MQRIPRSLLLIIGSFGLALVLFGAGVLYTLKQPGAGASEIGAPFALVTPTGESFSDASLRGKPHLVFFGYTHCPDFCPTTLAQITAAFRELGPDKEIGAVFVSVDPERDTPQAIAEYLQSFDPRIVGLTGTTAEVRAAARAFRVFFIKREGENDAEYTMDHTGVVYLMDRNGRFVSALNMNRPAKDVAAELAAYL